MTKFRFEEVKLPKVSIERKYYGTCPKCSGAITYGRVPCPDSRSGCLVAHYNYFCCECNSIFNMIKEDE